MCEKYVENVEKLDKTPSLGAQIEDIERIHRIMGEKNLECKS